MWESLKGLWWTARLRCLIFSLSLLSTCVPVIPLQPGFIPGLASGFGPFLLAAPFPRRNSCVFGSSSLYWQIPYCFFIWKLPNVVSIYLSLTKFFSPGPTCSWLSQVPWPQRFPRCPLFVLSTLGWQTFQHGAPPVLLQVEKRTEAWLVGLPKAKGIGVADDSHLLERSLKDPGCGKGGVCHANCHGKR